MERLTNSDKEIPTLDDNAEYWMKELRCNQNETQT